MVPFNLLVFKSIPTLDQNHLMFDVCHTAGELTDQHHFFFYIKKSSYIIEYSFNITISFDKKI